MKTIKVKLTKKMHRDWIRLQMAGFLPQFLLRRISGNNFSLVRVGK